MIRSDKGFGLLQIIMTLGIISLIALGVTQLNQTMSAQSLISKAEIGRDSLKNGFLSMVSVESLCTAQLNTTTPITFSLAKANQPPGGGTTPNLRQNLIFNLNNQVTPTTPGTLGWLNPGASQKAAFYPQFNAYVGAVYFYTPTGSPSFTEKVTGTPMTGATVYEGQLWMEGGRPNEAGPDGAEVVMAPIEVAPNFYLWVKGNSVVACGIIKSPDQVCVDDMGGVYNQGGSPPCTQIPSLCPLAGYYYLGRNPDGTPKCMRSAASCLANQTIVGGGGGWNCQTMPQ